MAVAAGRSFVADRVFPMRWGHVAELRRLGADVQCMAGGASIAGNCFYQGAAVVASDLRASAALVLAALAARGTTIIHAAHHLDRGYERLDLKLVRLGARVERTASPAGSFGPHPACRMVNEVDWLNRHDRDDSQTPSSLLDGE
jgi:UDP-N-acetylglucosamine 1-carboxyvinyltransferase